MRRAAHRLLAGARRQERDDRPRRRRHRACGRDRRPRVLLELPASCASRWSASTSTIECTPRSREAFAVAGAGAWAWRPASAGAATWARSSRRASWTGWSAHVDDAVARGARVVAGGHAAARRRPVLLRADGARGRDRRHDPVRRGDLRPGRGAVPGRTPTRRRSAWRTTRPTASTPPSSPVTMPRAARSRRRLHAGTVNINEAYGAAWGSLRAPWAAWATRGSAAGTGTRAC